MVAGTAFAVGATYPAIENCFMKKGIGPCGTCDHPALSGKSRTHIPHGPMPSSRKLPSPLGEAGRGLAPLLQPQLAYDIVSMPPAINDVEHVTDIDPYTTLQVIIETDVPRHGIPVAVEGQTDEFAAPVEHGAA